MTDQKKTRRSQPFVLDLGNGFQYKVPAFWRHHYVRNGWLIESRKRRLTLRSGVIGWIEEGALILRDTLTGVGVSIRSSWDMVERAALYDPRGASMTQDDLRREIQAQYAVTI